MDTSVNTQRPKILLVCPEDERIAQCPTTLDGAYDLLWTDDVRKAIEQMEENYCAGVYFSRSSIAKTQSLHELIKHEQVINGLPNGVAVLDDKKQIEWYNKPFEQFTELPVASLLKTDFYKALGNPESLGPDIIPLDEALGTGAATCCALKWDDSKGEEKYALLQVKPLFHTSEGAPGDVRQLLVSLTDVSGEFEQMRKLEAIYKAGSELADITPEEILQMSIQDRIEALKSNVLYFASELMNFDRIEVRLLDKQTNELRLLLSQGMDGEEENLKFYALADGNGASGFVAATGNYYICSDPDNDPHYIQGARGAKRSLTVPILFHDQVIGTFNVERLTEEEFTNLDVRNLEIFTLQLAMALNTLQLLAAEKTEGALSFAQSVLAAAALPVDGILKDSTIALENLENWGPGSKEHITESLFKIEKTAREIKARIRNMRSEVESNEGRNAPEESESNETLQGLRILVVDEDEGVRFMAHTMMDSLGADVETADSAATAASLLRRSEYNIFIIDIKLSDPPCIEFLENAIKNNLLDHTATILLAGFGYDPAHTIPKARALGITSILYKPFRIDQVKNRIHEALKEKTENRNLVR